MNRTKLIFPNGRGQELAGLLEAPAGTPRAYALFAHCFTCTKEIVAASRISRALTAQGIAVLRFDFTGLGGSDGDFANTDFTSNTDDLVAAADYLEAHHQAPALLIGHSLGGTAVLAAAARIAAARAIVTIAAPANAQHVKRLIAPADTARVDSAGAATVDIGGRPFRIGKQLLDDIAAHDSTDHIAALGKALLVFHSPADTIVAIDEATRIFQAARHPKSFVSLDGADHLLSRREDARYVAEVIAAWAGRYLTPAPEPVARPSVADGEVLVLERDHEFTRAIYTDRHELTADEPLAMGGGDNGFNPYELLLAALGACTSMTLRMYAAHKKLPLDDIRVRLRHERIHAEDCASCESKEGFVDRITRHIRVSGDLTEEQRTRLLEIADRCPVHKTLHNEIVVASELED